MQGLNPKKIINFTLHQTSFHINQKRMSMLKEFKAFAMKGNVVDLAVAVIIGAAFGKIIASFVADVLMPPIGLLLGGVEFTNLHLILKEATDESAAVTLNYGVFIQTMVDFVIVAGAVFMVIKPMNSNRKKQENKPAPPPEAGNEEKLLTEIRDILKK